MPIRLNLLAENQALEDLRRRDPVKRVILAAAILIVLMLVWSSSLQLSSIIAKGELNRLEAQIASKTNDYRLVLENQRTVATLNDRLGALQQLATNRFLQGSLLNALQQTTIDGVQLTRFRSDATYVQAETGAAKRRTITEKITLVLDAKDAGPNPSDQIDGFKQAIAASPYFQTAMGKTNLVRLINLGAQQTGPDGKPFVLFTLECRFPEKTR